MKRIKHVLSLLLSLCLCAGIFTVSAAATGVQYFPGVTEEMTKAEFWSGMHSDSDKLLATAEEIAQYNELACQTQGTTRYDLKSMPGTFNGISRCQALQKDAQADADYYIGWTFDVKGNHLDQAYFDTIIANCADPAATEEMPVRYGIITTRALLVTFPSDEGIYDDPSDLDFDYQSLVGIRVNEPVLVYTTSADGKYYSVITSCCTGWVKVEDVAICADRDEWLSAWDIPSDKMLLFYGDKMYTDYSITAPETSHRLITMGTVLERIDDLEAGQLVANRLPVHNYAVYLPVRGDDGIYSKVPALLNAREKLSESYLPLTQANIAKVAFGALGNAYGWGAMLYNEDCTSFNRNIYACFGLNTARNTNWQWLMPIDTLSIAGWSSEEKEALLDKLPLGALLQFPGHQMMYLGKYNDNYYVYSTVSSAMNPWQDGKRQRVRTTLINTLDVKRANGNTWMQSLSGVELPWSVLAEGEESAMPAAPWYHEGVDFCIKHSLMDTEAGYFRPNDIATRAELVATMWHCADSPDPKSDTLPFTDVPADADYMDAVLWAWENRVVMGTSDTTFSPDSGITREMLAVILYRFAGGNADEHRADLSAFEDAGDISDWALDAVQWTVDIGLIKGTSDVTLSPGGDVTRAQLATLIMRYASMLNS